MIFDGQWVEMASKRESNEPSNALCPYQLISNTGPVLSFEEVVHVYRRQVRMGDSNIAWVIVALVPISLLESSKEGRTRGDLYIKIPDAEHVDASHLR